MSTDTPSPTPPVSPAGRERPGRYPRTSGGLVLSLVVTVLALGALYWFTGLFRDTPEFEPEDIDYLASVAAIQDAGGVAVYPTALPDGWIATGVDVEPGDTTTFGLRMLTDEEKFVGIQVAEKSPTGLVAQWVDEDAVEADDYLPTDPDALDPQWEGFADDGGDTGYVAEIGDETVLVYGSASPEELQGIIDVLSDAPIKG